MSVSEKVVDYGMAGLLALVVCAGIIAVATYEPKPDPVHGWWTETCVASHTDTTMVLLPTSNGVSMGGIPIGSSLTLVPVTSTICDRSAWYCPEGRVCDPAVKPGNPKPSTNEP